MNSLRLTRNILEKWVDQPFFESVVVGFFVRVLIGMSKEKRMVYRLAQVQGTVKRYPQFAYSFLFNIHTYSGVTDAARPYQLGKKETCKQLSLKHAGNEKSFRMEFVSNQHFTEV